MTALMDVAVLCNCDEGGHTVRGAATPVPGLVIGPSPHHADEWSVTHILSGCLVAPMCPDPEGALHIAIALGDCGDWTRTGSDIALDAGMQMLRKATLANLGLLAAARDHPQVDMSRLRKHEAMAT